MRVSHQIVENIKYLNSDQRRLGAHCRPSSLKVLNSLLPPLNQEAEKGPLPAQAHETKLWSRRIVKLQKTLESPGFTDEKTKAQKEEKATST